MTLKFQINNLVKNRADWIFQWMLFMSNSVGWSVVASGDGLSDYSTTGNILTSSSSGANGLQNTGAWFVLQSPNNKNFCIQRGNTNLLWKIVYSSVGFTSGTPGPSTIPLAPISSFTGNPDQRIITLNIYNSTFIDFFNSPTTTAYDPVSKTFYTVILDTAFSCHFCADDTAPYSFYWVGNNPNDNSVAAGLASIFIFDPMANNTFPSIDADPYVTYLDGSKAIGSTTNLLSLYYASCYFLKNTPLEISTSIQAWPIGYSGQVLVPGGLPYNPITYNNDLFPIVWAKRASDGFPAGYKGQSSIMRWIGSAAENHSLLSTSVAGDIIVINQIALPWNSLPVNV